MGINISDDKVITMGREELSSDKFCELVMKAIDIRNDYWRETNTTDDFENGDLAMTLALKSLILKEISL